MEPSGYHGVNVALHALVTLLFSLLVRRLAGTGVGEAARWTASLAFAVHPIHCDAVASVVGRAELGAALHVLLALLAYDSYVRAKPLLQSIQLQ